MLALTNQAATAIRSLTDQPGLSEEAALRIESTVDEDQTRKFALSLTSEQQPADQVIESEGARVFMDATTAEELDDKALDAEISEQGQVQFLRPNTPLGGAASGAPPTPQPHPPHQALQCTHIRNACCGVRMSAQSILRCVYVCIAKPVGCFSVGEP
ncbi:hypothetical protein [Phytoactinopolyspora halotolerans]|uniref:hypothetical protein n=1 Tax=Phytoactinopolyspora halotolerans TaxID=1981512 RepID=UPI001C20AC0A|nr:hypothetical protein [Phytoactinopolyspora halotolerans]